MERHDQLNNIPNVEPLNVKQFTSKLLYQSNAFRLLELPVQASDREISRRKQVHDIAIRTQSPIPDGPCKIFPINISICDLDINVLVESLRDPFQRIIQEIFWFWPLPGNHCENDPALKCLMLNDTPGALSIWTEQSSDPKVSTICLHNQAISYHFSALFGNNLGQSDWTNYWKSALQAWKDLSILNDFWSLLFHRVHEIADPRLSIAHVKTIRKSINSIILSTLAEEAVRYAEGSDRAVAGILLNIPKEKIGIDIPQDILNLAIAPHREGINNDCLSAENKIEYSPASLDEQIELLIKEGNNHLGVIDSILPIGAPETAILRNNLYETIINCVDAFFTKTDDWEKSIELLTLANDLFFEPTKKQEIKAKIKQLKEYGSNNNYWHCKDYYRKGIHNEVRDQLELAYEAFTQSNYDEAIRLIKELERKDSIDSNTIEKAIKPPLAMCLDRKARECVSRGLSYFDSERSIIKRITYHIQSKNQQCLRSLYIVEKNLHESYSKLSDLYCMSCLSSIIGEYYVGGDGEHKYLLCKKCYQTDIAEREAIKANALKYLKEAYSLLLRANECNPKNKIVINDLKFVKEILQNTFNISTTESKAPEDSIKQTDKTPSPINQKPNNSGDEHKGCLILLGVMAILFFLIIIVSSMSAPTNRISPTTTSRPYGAIKTPTRKQPAILPTASSIPTVFLQPTLDTCKDSNSLTIRNKGQSVEICDRVTDVGRYSCPTCENGFYSYMELGGNFLIISYDWIFGNNIGQCVKVKDKVESLGNKPVFVVGSREGFDGSKCNLNSNGSVSCVMDYFQSSNQCK